MTIQLSSIRSTDVENAIMKVMASFISHSFTNAKLTARNAKVVIHAMNAKNIYYSIVQKTSVLRA